MIEFELDLSKIYTKIKKREELEDFSLKFIDMYSKTRFNIFKIKVPSSNLAYELLEQLYDLEFFVDFDVYCKFRLKNPSRSNIFELSEIYACKDNIK